MYTEQKCIQEALDEARKLAHPIMIGLTQEDQKEIHAYQTGVNNVEFLLKEKGILSFGKESK